jgi:hypothetical protein
MARLEDVERRLLNWARWKHGGGSGALGYVTVQYGVDTSKAAYRQAVVPTVDCEAEETDQAVTSLPVELRATVHEVYLGRGTAAERARLLGCSESTVKSRVWQAHRLIASWFSDQAQQRRDARARVEAAQKRARPGG